jgi:hypothetical protein
MKEITNAQLLLDVPETDTSFNFEAYADVLMSVILESDPRFTLGIYGGWGTGKTTLMKLIQTRLLPQDDSVHCVYFDAWRYQHETHMILPLLDTIYESLNKTKTRWQTVGVSLKDAVLSLAQGLSIKLPGVGINPSDIIETWKNRGKVFSDYYNHLGVLQDALDTIRKDDPRSRLVIFVDDLDRCLPAQALQLLESLKTIFDVSGIIFILGLDYTTIAKSVEKYHEGKYDISGTEYLKKLIQIEFKIPPTQKEETIEYVGKLLETLGIVSAEIKNPIKEISHVIIGENRREIKRFINSIILNTSILNKIGIAEPLERQVAFQAMSYRWPLFVSQLNGDPELLNRINTFINASLNAKEAKIPEEDSKGIVELFDNNLGLQEYLTKGYGLKLYMIPPHELKQLIFYSSLTKEVTTATLAQEAIDNALSTLTPPEQNILKSHFGLIDGKPRRPTEIMKSMGIKTQEFNNLEAKALRKLRHPTRSRKLREFTWRLSEIPEGYRALLEAIFGIWIANDKEDSVENS